MADKNIEALNEVIAALETAKEKAETKLAPSLYGNHVPRIINKLNQELNQLKHLAGMNLGNETVQFEPISSFMGEKIQRREMLDTEKITPSEADKEVFVKKVNDLYDAFPQMANDAILNSYRADTSVIRGVAKKAGLQNYKEAELNFLFLDLIRDAIAAKAVSTKVEQAATTAAAMPKKNETGKKK